MNPKQYEDYLRQAPKQYQDPGSFHDWFNRSKGVDDSTKNGFIDFVHKIFTLDFYPRLGNPTERTCCEIGFGGGRLLNAASCFFKTAHGIDIHEDFTRTEEYLRSNNRHNFKLHTMEQALDGSILPETVDFLYSFITFQHFPSWQTAEDYLKMTKKILSPSGCGIIYFGLGNLTSMAPEVQLPNQISSGEPFPIVMRVSPQFAIAQLKSVGLTPIETCRGSKKPWTDDPSGQFYIKFSNGGPNV